MTVSVQFLWVLVMKGDENFVASTQFLVSISPASLSWFMNLSFLKRLIMLTVPFQHSHLAEEKFLVIVIHKISLTVLCPGVLPHHLVIEAVVHFCPQLLSLVQAVVEGRLIVP